MRIVPQAVVVLGQLLVLGACCGSVHGLPSEEACPYVQSELAWDDEATTGLAPADQSAPYLGDWVTAGRWALDGAPTEVASQVYRDADETPIFFDGQGECPDFVQIPMTMAIVASDGGLAVSGPAAWNAPVDPEPMSLATEVAVADAQGSFDPASELRRGESADTWSLRMDADGVGVTGSVRLDISGSPNRYVEILAF